MVTDVEVLIVLGGAVIAVEETANWLTGAPKYDGAGTEVVIA